MASARPLDGVRVVDLTHEWAGPHATRLLADFGADVIKVEYARRMDIMRLARKEGRAYDHHPRWLQLHRNKQSVTLDLKQPGDVQLFKDLVQLADVVVESSRPGVLARLGLGYDVLSALRPDLIMVSMSGFGQTGPEASYAGYGGCLEAVSGLQALTAYDRDGRPMRVREMDVINGVSGACAIMTALVHRRTTGRGQWIDLSQLETTTGALMGEPLLEYMMNGRATAPRGNRHATYAPQGCYRCRGEDEFVVLTIRSDAEWVRFCELIGRPDLRTADEFATQAARARHHDELDRVVEKWTVTQSHRDAMRLLQERGLAAAAVLSVAELATDPHLRSRGYFETAEDGTPHPFPGMPFKLADGAGVIRRRGPALGEHNRAVFCGLLDRAEDEIQPVKEEEIGTAFDVE